MTDLTSFYTKAGNPRPRKFVVDLPDGTQGKRSSENRVYTHAIVKRLPWGWTVVSWASSESKARRRLGQFGLAQILEARQVSGPPRPTDDPAPAGADALVEIDGSVYPVEIKSSKKTGGDR